MKDFFLRKLNPFLLMVCFLIVFGLGFWIGQGSVVCKFCSPEDLDFSLFWETWHMLQEKYVNREEIDTQKLIYGAIAGMVNSLDDPYTVFFEPEASKKFLEDVSGSFEGVGMEIGIRKEQLQVLAPLEGTPAQRAGLRPGDKIIKIDDTLTIDITIEEAATLIRGPKGTDVVLTVIRDDWDASQDFTITRAVIEIPTLTYEIISPDNGGDIAYIKIYHFSEKVSSDFSEVAYEVLGSSAEKIILDLRSNPGGYLEVAEDIAGWFLERNQVILIEDFGDEQGEKTYKARGNAKLSNYPIVILINEGTASASEILASAIRDNRGAKIVGVTSFGKGSVQELAGLSGDSSLKVTIAKWLTPNSKLIEKVGLEPDYEVEMTEEDYEEGSDPQLDRAIELLK